MAESRATITRQASVVKVVSPAQPRKTGGKRSGEKKKAAETRQAGVCDGVEGWTHACAEGHAASVRDEAAASAGGVEGVTAVTEGGEPAVAAAKEGGEEVLGARRGGVAAVTAVTEGEAGEEEVLRLGEPPRVRCKSWAAVDSSSGQVMCAKMKMCA